MNQQILSRPRGRPRAFNEDDAVAAAIQVFWRHGYKNASLDDLTAAMKIARPSLYAAFGDKEGLFLRCVQAQGKRIRDSMFVFIENEMDAKRGLLRVMEFGIDVYTARAPMPRGCMLASASISDVPLSEKIREKVYHELKTISETLYDMVENDPPPNMTAKKAVHMVTTFQSGVAARARLGEPAEQLKEDMRLLIGMIYPDR